MTGVLIVTHGRLGEALLEAAGMISGGTHGAKALGFSPGQGVEALEASVRDTLASLEADEGILCLVDLPGGSPARVAAGLAAAHSNLQVVSGANLPMLVEVLLLRESVNAAELAVHAAQSGAEGILDIGSLLRAELAKEG